MAPADAEVNAAEDDCADAAQHWNRNRNILETSSSEIKSLWLLQEPFWKALVMIFISQTQKYVQYLETESTHLSGNPKNIL